MGREFRPARVYKAATDWLETVKVANKPLWYDTIGEVTPAQRLVRTQPIPHQPRRMQRGTRKASKLFMPQKITYEEDTLRREFYKDHPWELARPRKILEDTGTDSYNTNWSRMQQTHKVVDSER